MTSISVTLTGNPQDKPSTVKEMGFGKLFTDHMFMMNYRTGRGWYDPRIVPFGDLSLSPASLCLHYGQTVFEGLKAYCGRDGQVRLFRPDENFNRLNRSNQRLCIPRIDPQFCLEALKQLVTLEKDWVPRQEGASLYIRPFVIATDPKLGVKSGDEYLFIIILSPSGAYYESGLEPVKIYVESNYVRAVRGGMGEAKTGGNYAASLAAQDEAHEQGYSQVMWLDGVEQKYIEEIGAMNAFFLLDGQVVTPGLTGSILAGITRKSVISLLERWGIPVAERRVEAQELVLAYERGLLQEAFCTGTAAVISPIGELKWREHVMTMNGGETGPVARRLYDALTGIQYGTLPDEMGWKVNVCHI